MIASIEPLNSGFALSDPKDPRFQYVVALRRRFGTFLRNASSVLRRTGDENVVDPILILVCDLRAGMQFTVLNYKIDWLHPHLHA